MENDISFWERLSPLTKIATVLFALGKMTGIMSILALLASPTLAIYTGIVYAALIGACILICLVQLYRTEKQRKKPTMEQVEEWAKEYNLIKE